MKRYVCESSVILGRLCNVLTIPFAAMEVDDTGRTTEDERAETRQVGIDQVHAERENRSAAEVERRDADDDGAATCLQRPAVR